VTNEKQRAIELMERLLKWGNDDPYSGFSPEDLKSLGVSVDALRDREQLQRERDNAFEIIRAADEIPDGKGSVKYGMYDGDGNFCPKHLPNIPMLEREVEQARGAVAACVKDLEEIVCTEEPDRGVVLLSSDGPTHTEEVNGRPCQVYDHEHFSPLGDALIALHTKLKGIADANSSR
jgi:hypothetical protein